VYADLDEMVGDYRDLLVCVPSHVFRSTLEAIQPKLRPDARIAWATKGFEVSSGQLPHAVAREVLGDKRELAVISGPTFAREVGAGLPTAITVAATTPEFADFLATEFSDEVFRAYTSSDLIGVEVGGAVKNILAIAVGMADGMGHGANTRVALITRGLAEMSRLGIALGGNADTFMGLSGMGDLVLTCTDDQSRNRRMGLALATGKSVAAAAEEIGQVVEGVKAALAVHNVAAKESIEMPICELVYRIVHEGLAPEAAQQVLMGRSLTAES
jgi:glycerol-3-phosphate dehydrogenase (NAD(P)+)